MKRTVVAVLLGLALGGLALRLAAEDVLLDLAAEDGVLETLQALAYLVAAVVCAVGLRRGWASRWAYPVGLVSLLLAGEEISWGQRLLGFTGPEQVVERNRQGEFNVHNLPGVHESIRDVGVVVLVLGVVALPLLLRRSAAWRRRAERIGWVTPGLVATVSALVAVAYMRVPRWFGVNDYGYDEVGELYLSATVLAYAGRVAAARRR